MTSLKLINDPVLRRLTDDVSITFRALASYLREYEGIKDDKEADEFYRLLIKGALSKACNFWNEN